MDSYPVRKVFDLYVAWIEDIPVAEAACLLCGQRDFVLLNSFVLNGRPFHTVRCRADGMMWLEPRPRPEFYRQLYREHYHQAGPGDPLFEQATLDVHSDEAGRKAAARIRLDEIERYVRAGRLLEVGFGSLHTLREARARGWEVLGMEVSPACVEAARAEGIPALCVHLPEYEGPAASFDVVAMYSLIEHVPDPPAYLRQAFDLLRPGGILVLRLPDTPAEGPPASLIAHLHHFNRRTIAALLTRCGFQVLWFGSVTVWRPTRYPGSLPSMNVISRKAERTSRRGSREVLLRESAWDSNEPGHAAPQQIGGASGDTTLGTQDTYRKVPFSPGREPS